MSPRKTHYLSARLPSLIESLLFVADGPVEENLLARSLGLPIGAIRGALDTLAESCRERGIRLQRKGTEVQFVTDPEAAEYVERFLGLEQRARLSNSALEVLAIIAYRQPVTRAAIDAIRGVNSDYGVSTLVSRGLIEEVGRAPGPGKPALFGTTIRFLEHFGLERPEDLPPLAEDLAVSAG